MENISVRAAVTDDFTAAALLRWQWDAERDIEPVTTQREYVEAFSGWATAHASSHHGLLLLRDDRVIGMAWLAVTGRPPIPTALVRTSGDVQSVYIVPEERGAGLGARLIDALLQLAADLHVGRVTVHSSTRAINAYVRAGFVNSPHLLDLVMS